MHNIRLPGPQGTPPRQTLERMQTLLDCYLRMQVLHPQPKTVKPVGRLSPHLACRETAATEAEGACFAERNALKQKEQIMREPRVCLRLLDFPSNLAERQRRSGGEKA